MALARVKVATRPVNLATCAKGPVVCTDMTDCEPPPVVPCTDCVLPGTLFLILSAPGCSLLDGISIPLIVDPATAQASVEFDIAVSPPANLCYRTSSNEGTQPITIDNIHISFALGCAGGIWVGGFEISFRDTTLPGLFNCFFQDRIGFFDSMVFGCPPSISRTLSLIGTGLPMDEMVAPCAGPLTYTLS